MKSLVYASVVAGILASIVATVMILLFGIIRRHSRKRNAPSSRTLTLCEKKLWICALITIVLMERYVFVYLSVFEDNPVAVVDAAMMKQYFKALLLSLVWPPPLFLIMGSAAVLVLNRSRERASGSAAVPVQCDRRVLGGAGIAYCVLVTASFLLLLLNQIHASLFYPLLLFGRFFAYLVIILSIHESSKET